MKREFFQDRPRNLKSPFRWLIGISRSADGNVFSNFYFSQFPPQQACCVLLDIDFPFEIHAIPHFHKFVCIAGVAIFAGKFTAPIWIDSPREWHSVAAATV